MDSPKTNTSSTSVACLKCRERHLKCDGNQEGCDRCRASSLACHFVPSRRGRRGQPSQFVMVDQSHVPMMEEIPFLDASLPLGTPTDLAPAYTEPVSGLRQMRMQLIEPFYEHFHPAHPILLPFDIWIISLPPQYLVDIVELIGLHYLSPSQMPAHFNDLLAATGHADVTLEQAQAYILSAILFHGHGAPDHAKKCIGLAIESSFSLGLHCRELSDTVEMHSSARAESMRRTLWEALIVDTLLAAVQFGGSLQFNMETPDVSLPSEDESFIVGHPGSFSISARDLDHRGLSDDEHLSSHAYRVEAALILRRCLIACETHADEDTLETLDFIISAWFHRWPYERNQILQLNGKVNQADFQSAMIMHCASIYLHFSKSFLVSFLPSTRELFCSRPPIFSSPSPNAQVHTAKVASSASELSKLASLSTSVAGHSPFFACTLVLSSIVQVTVLNTPVGQPHGKQLSCLALNLGVLKSIGRIWNIAASSLEKLRDITREVKSAATDVDQQAIGSTSFTVML